MTFTFSAPLITSYLTFLNKGGELRTEHWLSYELGVSLMVQCIEVKVNTGETHRDGNRGEINR